MTITIEKLDEIERGLEGVTPGPWRRGIQGNSSVYGPDAQCEHSGLIARVFKGSDNAAHIARLDPTTVAELVRLARVGLAVEARPDLAAVLRGEAVVAVREYEPGNPYDGPYGGPYGVARITLKEWIAPRAAGEKEMGR